MDFGRENLRNETSKKKIREEKRWMRGIMLGFKVLLVTCLFLFVVGGAFLLGSINGILEAAPSVSIDDVAPKGLSTEILDKDGNVIQTLTGAGANRTLVEYKDVPESLVNAFVAIEDERFWEHEGIDVKGIFRAGFVGLSSGSFTEGASTITQQLIKNNVFDGGLEQTTGARFVRKIQEQAMALELEKTATKEDIMINYLNTINLGQSCLGVEKAAERYFGKSVSDLTISECATIAAITQNPYAYNPINFPEKNAERRLVVLTKMVQQGYITEAEKQEALADDVYARISEVNANYHEDKEVYSYFVDRLINDVLKDLQNAGYSYSKATSLLYSGGLKIHTTQDSSLQAIVDEEVNNPSNYSGVQTKYSFSYQMRVVHEDGTFVDYTTTDVQKYAGNSYIDYSSKDKIYSIINSFKSAHTTSGDTITIDNLTITLQPQASVVLMDQSTGQVLALSGGRGEKTTNLSLNRATSTMRQPGSTFKVLASFAPALEYGSQTLASTFTDEPFSFPWNGGSWSPKNWWGSTYVGDATIQQGITYSMNIVAARCLVEKVGIDASYKMVENFGINTLIPKNSENSKTGLNDESPNLALGGITQGVTNLQLTAAYASIANAGMYNEPTLYTFIEDSSGNVIFQKKAASHRTISEGNAYLLTRAMQTSMESSTLRGLVGSTSTAAKPSNMTAAGKSGTTDNSNDLWFVGYTPYYTMGIWSGFDDNNKLGSGESTSYHKTIWKNIMEKASKGQEVVDFTEPKNIVQVEICTQSGKLADASCRYSHNVEKYYFVEGTQPLIHCGESGYVPSQYTVVEKTSEESSESGASTESGESGATKPGESTGATETASLPTEDKKKH